MIVVYDLETTGLLKRGVRDFLQQPGITQIGAVKLDPDAWCDRIPDEGSADPHNVCVVDEFNQLVNPELPFGQWEDKAMKITGITPDTVKAAPSFFVAGKLLADFCVGARVIAGFNNQGFDDDVLWFQLERYGMLRSFPWPPQNIDVMQLATEHLGSVGAAGNRLSNVYKKVTGLELEGAHDALNDVRATARVLRDIGREVVLRAHGN